MNKANALNLGPLQIHPEDVAGIRPLIVQHDDVVWRQLQYLIILVLKGICPRLLARELYLSLSIGHLAALGRHHAFSLASMMTLLGLPSLEST